MKESTDRKAESSTLEDGSTVLTLSGTWYNTDAEALQTVLAKGSYDYIFANGCRLGVKPIETLREQFTDNIPPIFIIGADIMTGPAANGGAGTMTAQTGCPPFVRTSGQLSQNLLLLPDNVIHALRENLTQLLDTNEPKNHTQTTALRAAGGSAHSRVTQLNQASHEIENAIALLTNEKTPKTSFRSF